MLSELIKNKIIALELELNDFETRKNSNRLNELIADDFLEIGSSGKEYTKEQILELLVSSESCSIQCFDFDVREISDDVIQVFYKTEAQGRKSTRSSIWIHKDNSWKILYHQGTKI